MSRGNNSFKTMEFEDGVCKNAMSDNIVTKNIGDMLNKSFVEYKEIDDSVLVEKANFKKFLQGSAERVNEWKEGLKKAIPYTPIQEPNLLDIERGLKKKKERLIGVKELDDSMIITKSGIEDSGVEWEMDQGANARNSLNNYKNAKGSLLEQHYNNVKDNGYLKPKTQKPGTFNPITQQTTSNQDTNKLAQGVKPNTNKPGFFGSVYGDIKNVAQSPKVKNTFDKVGGFVKRNPLLSAGIGVGALGAMTLGSGSKAPQQVVDNSVMKVKTIGEIE